MTKVLGGVFERNLLMREAGAHGLHTSGVFRVFRLQGDSARHQHAGQIVHGCQRHHHRGQSFVAGGHADDAAARGQRADEPPEDRGGVVAIGQAVEHSVGALGAPVAWVRARARKRHSLQRL